MPEIEGFFVSCYECGNDVRVCAATFNRVLRRESWIVCEACTAMATHCANGDAPTKSRGVEDVK